MAAKHDHESAGITIIGAGEVIERWRKAAGFASHQKLAEKIGCHKGDLSRYEHNQVGVPLERISRIAEACNRPPAELIMEMSAAVFKKKNLEWPAPEMSDEVAAAVPQAQQGAYKVPDHQVFVKAVTLGQDHTPDPAATSLSY